MTSVVVPKVEGSNAKLEKPSDWKRWSNDFKTKAARLRLWKHIDPDEGSPEEFLTNPTKPKFSDYHTPATRAQAGGESILTGRPAERFKDLDKEQQAEYKFEYTMYLEDLKAYEA